MPGDAPTRVRSTLDNLRHGNFDPEADPVATVTPGDDVTIETVSPYSVDLLTDAGVSRDEILDDEIEALRHGAREGPGPHVVTGPVTVEGAEPGDVLEVQVRDVELRTSYGVNSFGPGIGVLPDAFEETNVRVIRLERERGTARLAEGVTVPLDPFFGIVAVAPPVEQGRVSTTPPSFFGGNLDVGALGPGSTIYFPIHVEGARFFVGDGHAAQGDGEVDSTAIETSLTGEFGIRLHRGELDLDYPVAETDEHYVVLGIDETLDGALEHAVREAVTMLVRQEELSTEDAYRTCSTAVDFAVSQAVNGNEGVHGLLPKSIFGGGSTIDPARFHGSVDWTGGTA